MSHHVTWVRWALTLATFSCFMLGGTLQGFTYGGSQETETDGSRWEITWEDQEMPISYTLDGEVPPLGYSDQSFLSDMRIGIQSWDAVTSASLSMVDAGLIATQRISHIPVTFLRDPNAPFIGISWITGKFDRYLRRAVITKAPIQIVDFWGPRTPELLEERIAHEMGHSLGLSHSNINGSIMSYTTNSLPLSQDDIAGISELYPAPSLASSYGSIEGRVTDGRSSQALCGAWIVVREVATDKSIMTKQTGTDGYYKLVGLPPGTYKVQLAPNNAQLGGLDWGASIPNPCSAGAFPPVEYYDANESGTDNPNTFQSLSVAAGTKLTGINLIANTGSFAGFSDATPPTISIFSPQTNEVVSGTIPVYLTASDDFSGINRVELWVDGLLIASDNQAPYIISLDTTRTSIGSHMLTAKAYDRAGNMSTSSAVTVTVSRDTAPPIVTILSPSAGVNLQGTVQIQVRGTDDSSPITHARLYINGVKFAETSTIVANVATFSWDTTKVSNGTYSLKARMFDAPRNWAFSTPINVIVNNFPDTLSPTVQITSPLSGDTFSYPGQLVTVEAMVSDDRWVTKVELYTNGTRVFATADNGGFAHYHLYWKIPDLGSFSSATKVTLEVRAYDAAGNVGISAPVTLKPTAAISSVQLARSTFGIDGTAVSGTATLINNTPASINAFLGGWIEQGTVRRDAGLTPGSVNCGRGSGILPPGSCTVGFTLSANDVTSTGSGQFVAGPATVGFDLSYTGSYGATGRYTVPVVLVVPLSFSSFSASPSPFSPNSDSFADYWYAKGSFNHPASWKCQLKNTAGSIVRTLSGNTGSGVTFSQSWDGKGDTGLRLPDGSYTYVFTGTDSGGGTTSRSGTVLLDLTGPTITGLSVTPNPFRPSVGQTTTMRFTLSEPANVRFQIWNSAGPVRTLLGGLSTTFLTTLTNSVLWDGKTDAGFRVPAGAYTYRLWATDQVQNKASRYPVSGSITVQ